jgi:hypothetical protein
MSKLIGAFATACTRLKFGKRGDRVAFSLRLLSYPLSFNAVSYIPSYGVSFLLPPLLFCYGLQAAPLNFV